MERQPSNMSEKGPPTPAEGHALGYTDGPVVPRWKQLLKRVGTAENDAQRGMQSRHLTMIGESYSFLFREQCSDSSTAAIGGTIGTGIFLSIGAVHIFSRL
jgi:hypothetical protein